MSVCVRHLRFALHVPFGQLFCCCCFVVKSLFLPFCEGVNFSFCSSLFILNFFLYFFWMGWNAERGVVWVPIPPHGKGTEKGRKRERTWLDCTHTDLWLFDDYYFFLGGRPPADTPFIHFLVHSLFLGPFSFFPPISIFIFTLQRKEKRNRRKEKRNEYSGGVVRENCGGVHRVSFPPFSPLCHTLFVWSITSASILHTTLDFCTYNYQKKNYGFSPSQMSCTTPHPQFLWLLASR